MRGQVVLAAVLCFGCGMLGPPTLERADRSQVDLRSAQELPGESLRIGYDCQYRLLGAIPIWRLYPTVERAEADVMRFAPPHQSFTRAVYFEQSWPALLTKRDCWQVWIRFEGVPD